MLQLSVLVKHAVYFNIELCVITSCANIQVKAVLYTYDCVMFGFARLFVENAM